MRLPTAICPLLAQHRLQQRLDFFRGGSDLLLFHFRCISMKACSLFSKKIQLRDHYQYVSLGFRNQDSKPVIWSTFGINLKISFAPGPSDMMKSTVCPRWWGIPVYRRLTDCILGGLDPIWFPGGDKFTPWSGVDALRQRQTPEYSRMLLQNLLPFAKWRNIKLWIKSEIKAYLG